MGVTAWVGLWYSEGRHVGLSSAGSMSTGPWYQRFPKCGSRV